MEFIDTHCHIYYDKYQDDINNVINKANENNIKYFDENLRITIIHMNWNPLLKKIPSKIVRNMGLKNIIPVILSYIFLVL